MKSKEIIEGICLNFALDFHFDWTSFLERCRSVTKFRNAWWWRLRGRSTSRVDIEFRVPSKSIVVVVAFRRWGRWIGFQTLENTMLSLGIRKKSLKITSFFRSLGPAGLTSSKGSDSLGRMLDNSWDESSCEGTMAFFLCLLRGWGSGGVDENPAPEDKEGVWLSRVDKRRLDGAGLSFKSRLRAEFRGSPLGDEMDSVRTRSFSCNLAFSAAKRFTSSSAIDAWSSFSFNSFLTVCSSTRKVLRWRRVFRSSSSTLLFWSVFAFNSLYNVTMIKLF